MSDNPWGREYTLEEWRAARRVGLATEGGGPLVYASPSNPLIPGGARKAAKSAADWAVVAAAFERESKKPLAAENNEREEQE